MSTSLRSVNIIFLWLTIQCVYLLTHWHLPSFIDVIGVCAVSRTQHMRAIIAVLLRTSSTSLLATPTIFSAMIVYFRNDSSVTWLMCRWDSDTPSVRSYTSTDTYTVSILQSILSTRIIVYRIAKVFCCVPFQRANLHFQQFLIKRLTLWICRSRAVTDRIAVGKQILVKIFLAGITITWKKVWEFVKLILKPLPLIRLKCITN